MMVGAFLNAQEHPDSLVRKGIQFQQKGEYNQAIQKYQEVLRAAPQHPQAHYELALAFFSLKDYNLALNHSNAVLNQSQNNYQKGAYLIKGSALDNLGRPQAAILVYEEGIKKYPANYLLYYNLALSSFNSERFEKAETAILGSLQRNPNHASSHLLLAHLMAQTERRVQAVLGLYYFLMLEPETIRSSSAYEMLQNLLKQGVKKNRSNQVTINLSKAEKQPDFGAAELMLSTLSASRSLESNKYKTEAELFSEHTQAFFSVLGSSPAETGFWRRMYTKFFSDMAASGHAKAFAYHVSRSQKKHQIDQWLSGHPDEMGELINWVRYYN